MAESRLHSMRLDEIMIRKLQQPLLAPSTGFIRMRSTIETKMGNILLENLQIEQGISLQHPTNPINQTF